MRKTLKTVSLVAALGFTANAQAADGKSILEADCAGCHNLTGPAPTTLEALHNRKAPDLFYAGNKYKQEWLESWLQKPTRVRPAGMYYGKHLTQGAKGDVIDEGSLTKHPALSADKAKAVAKALAKLTAKSELIKKGEYQPGSIPMTMGEMLFDKFRGCMACNQIEPEYGGLSGPEVYTAARRLQEDYMISYMRNPQAWDPRTFMPNKHLSDTDLQKLVHYMRALAKEDWK